MRTPSLARAVALAVFAGLAFAAAAPELLKQVRALGPRSRVLIVGHSDTVPELLAAFGHANTLAIAKGEYDNLFLIVPGTGSQPVVLRLRY